MIEVGFLEGLVEVASRFIELVPRFESLLSFKLLLKCKISGVHVA